MTETFDDIISFGKYQIISTLLLCLPATFLDSWSSFGLVFLLYSPDKHCIQWNDTLEQIYINTTLDDCQLIDELSSKNYFIHCEKWVYDNQYFDTTVVTAWNMVCKDQKWVKSLISIYNLVGVLAALPMGFVMDYFGRKVAFLLSLTLECAGGILCLLAPTFATFATLRGFMATQTVTAYGIPLVWAMEFVSSDKRTWVNFLLTLTYSIASITLGLVAYACRTWVQLSLAIAMLFLVFYAYIFILDESPRWLLSMGRIDEATRIMQRIYQSNGIKADSVAIRQHLQAIADESHKKTSSLGSKRPTVFDLFRSDNLRAKTILITLTWAATTLVYSSVAFHTPNLTNLYGAYMIQAAIEAPAAFVNLLLLNRLGRIVPMFAAMLFSVLFCFLCIPAYLLQWNTWCIIVFTALVKFGVCVGSNICNQASSELYPTTLRATGMNFSGLIGQSCIIILPLILQTAETHKSLPMLIWGVLLSVAACGTVFLPETMRETMPQTTEEAERFGMVSCRTARDHFSDFLLRKKKIPEQEGMLLDDSAYAKKYGT